MESTLQRKRGKTKSQKNHSKQIVACCQLIHMGHKTAVVWYCLIALSGQAGVKDRYDETTHGEGIAQEKKCAIIYIAHKKTAFIAVFLQLQGKEAEVFRIWLSPLFSAQLFFQKLQFLFRYQAENLPNKTGFFCIIKKMLTRISQFSKF